MLFLGAKLKMPLISLIQQHDFIFGGPPCFFWIMIKVIWMLILVSSLHDFLLIHWNFQPLQKKVGFFLFVPVVQGGSSPSRLKNVGKEPGPHVWFAPNPIPPSQAAVGVGVFKFLMTLVSVQLVEDPRCGRRPLLLIGTAGMPGRRLVSPPPSPAGPPDVLGPTCRVGVQGRTVGQWGHPCVWSVVRIVSVWGRTDGAMKGAYEPHAASPCRFSPPAGYGGVGAVKGGGPLRRCPLSACPSSS